MHFDFSLIAESFSSPEFLTFWLISFFLYGCCFGSFLNVVIWRMPRGESLLFVPSHCPTCNHKLAWYDNIPLLAWLYLRGKCRYCRAPVTPRYFIVELLTALLITLTYYLYVRNHYAHPEMIVRNVLLIMSAIAIAFIDWKHRIIPNKINYFLILFALAWAALFPDVWRFSYDQPGPLTAFEGAQRAALNGLTVGGILWLFRAVGTLVFRKEALGLGDVKYAFALGALIGALQTAYVFFAGALLALIFGLYVIILRLCRGRRAHLNAALPYGPFLSVSVIVWIFYGQKLAFLSSKIIGLFDQHFSAFFRQFA